MYVDVFVGDTGQWYEFRCEEEAFIKDIIEEIYFTINCLRNEKQDKKQNENKNRKQEQNRKGDHKMNSYGLYELGLNLICIESQEILNKYKKLKDCTVENGNRLILI